MGELEAADRRHEAVRRDFDGRANMVSILQEILQLVDRMNTKLDDHSKQLKELRSHSEEHEASIESLVKGVKALSSDFANHKALIEQCNKSVEAMAKAQEENLSSWRQHTDAGREQTKLVDEMIRTKEDHP